MPLLSCQSLSCCSTEERLRQSYLYNQWLKPRRCGFQLKNEKPAAHLDVSQSTPQHAQIGGLLLLDIRDVFLQRLEALLQVRSPGTTQFELITAAKCSCWRTWRRCGAEVNLKRKNQPVFLQFIVHLSGSCPGRHRMTSLLMCAKGC